jgi:hypothetical protein
LGIRKFTIYDDGINLAINNYQTIDDTANFRRRDYNLVHQIFPNRQEGITAFGGVFQYNALLPYLMPGLMGTDAGFIINPAIPSYHYKSKRFKDNVLQP